MRPASPQSNAKRSLSSLLPKFRSDMPIKNVAVIGAGPSGAIAVDALVQEKTFDRICVFERQEKAGGCWFVAVDRPFHGCKV